MAFYDGLENLREFSCADKIQSAKLTRKTNLLF